MRLILFLLVTTLLFSCSNNGNSDNNGRSGTFSEFVKPTGKTFAVSDVELADTLIKTDSAINVFENKIDKKILFYPTEFEKSKLVNCYNNGLIQTLQECYDNHRPLILTPDVIWLAICQGVSIHINEKFDSLENIIFVKNKPKKIEIQNDSLEFDVKHWGNLIASFSDETKKYTKEDYYTFFVSQFSTTTSIDKTTYQITMLESYKKAFEYVGDSGCGIPSITITGEKSDWQSIYSKLEMLNNLGLSNWCNNLKPIISEFINVSDGNINKEFWQSIYKNAREYGAFYISGWILKFFPYIKVLENEGTYDRTKDARRLGEIFLPNPYLEGSRYLLSTLSTDNFPSGIAKINVTWNNYFKNVKKDIEIYAGFFAIKQYSDKTLEPLISWAVCDSKASKPNHVNIESEYLDLKHNDDLWSPHFPDSIADSAVYDIKKFKSQKASLDFVKKVLLDSIANHSQFSNSDLSDDTLEFVVFSNGETGEFMLIGDVDSSLKNYISEKILQLPQKWFPALVHPRDFLILMDDFTDKQNKVKVRANSKITMSLRK